MRTVDVGPAAESPSSSERSNSRRTLLARIARLSMVAAPAALLMFGPATASAEERGRYRRDGADGQDGFPFGQGGSPFGPGSPFSRQDNAQQDDGGRRGGSFLTLVTVGSVNGGTGGGDFGANNPGGDALTSGSLGINDSDHRVFVDVRGATANASYDVVFVRLNDHAREDLGSISTGDRGEFSGAAPNALSANQRVGTFVLARNGQDQFVTVFA